MENREYSSQVISSDTIKAKCSVENESLYYCEYTDLIPKGHILLRITHCEIRNINKKTFYNGDRVLLEIEFDLIFIYEYCDNSKTVMQYNHHAERVKKVIQIEKREYTFLSMEASLYDMECSNHIKNINYLYDIDSTSTKVVISISVTIESFLICAETLIMPKHKFSNSNANKYNFGKDLVPGSNIILTNENTIKDNIEQMETAFYSILSQVYDIRNINNMLRETGNNKKSQINYLETQAKNLEQKVERLINNLKEKERILAEMNKHLEGKEAIIRELNEANKKHEVSIRVLTAENLDLKLQIDNLSNQDTQKSPLINRIKSFFM